MADLAVLQGHLQGLGRVVLGYSGGVDSAFLAAVAARTLGPDRFLAVLGVSPSLSSDQADLARGLAGRLGIAFKELPTTELDDPRYRANATDRCFYCKSELWSRLVQLAADLGYDVVIDGTNADDLAEHRPGLRAAAESGVRSPLAELGWTKADIRAAARDLGLSVWNAPAAPCLSSRIRYGLEVSEERLRQVEATEAWLRRLGVEGDLRVRHHGARATIEVRPDQTPLLEERWADVRSFFRDQGFAAVERDPRGYRRGSLLPLASVG